MKFLLANPFYLYYADEGNEGNENNNDGSGDDTVKGGNAGDDIKDKKFTQEEVNKFLAEDRRKVKVQTEKTIKELEVLQKSKALSEKEKSSLQGKIDELNNSLLTKDELAKKEKEKLETSYKQTVQSLTSERDTWQNRFISSQINQAITSEAAKAEAFDDQDVIDKLGPNTRLIEDTDDDGKATGRFSPKVKYSEPDETGKPITLELTVAQAVQRMKENQKYAHLFKSTATGGLGATNGAGGTKPVDIKSMSHEQYLEYRKKLKLNRKVGQ